MFKQALVIFKLGLITNHHQICIPFFLADCTRISSLSNSKSKFQKSGWSGKYSHKFYKIAGEWIANFVREY